MKAIKTFMLLVLMAGLALAQASTTNKTTATTTKPATKTTKTPAAKTTSTAPAKTATKPSTTAQKPAPKASPMAPKTASKKPTEVNPPAKTTTPETAKKPEAAKPGAHRDPFVSPIMERTTGGGPVACAGGKKCLPIDQLNLQGVVQTVDGMIAIVANPANRVYYLHESDPLWDGYVVKIMLDQKTQTGAVIFRQNVIDKVGQQSTRDVTKRVEAPAL